MRIYFKPESDDKPELAKAALEYADIWSSEGERIEKALTELTSSHFTDEEIEATIYEGRSQSHPLKLRASYSLDVKKGTLVHELGHRILATDKTSIKPGPKSVGASRENHKYLNLILYDVWVRLYGKDFADEQVVIESKRAPGVYEAAWKWALSFSEVERAERFKTHDLS